MIGLLNLLSQRFPYELVAGASTRLFLLERADRFPLRLSPVVVELGDDFAAVRAMVEELKSRSEMEEKYARD